MGLDKVFWNMNEFSDAERKPGDLERMIERILAKGKNGDLESIMEKILEEGKPQILERVIERILEKGNPRDLERAVERILEKGNPRDLERAIERVLEKGKSGDLERVIERIMEKGKPGDWEKIIKKIIEKKKPEDLERIIINLLKNNRRLKRELKKAVNQLKKEQGGSVEQSCADQEKSKKQQEKSKEQQEKSKEQQEKNKAQQEKIKEHQERVKEQQEKKRKKINRLVSLRAEADNAEAEIAYSKLFGRIGGAVQKLFALAKEEEEREHYERILGEEIQQPIKEAFLAFHVDFADTGISLPLRQAEAELGLMDRLWELSNRDLEDAMKECRGRIERAGRYKIPKGAVNGAAGSLRRLIETPAAELNWQQMKVLSEEIEKAFIGSGLYPLFRRDKRVLERPDLCALFIEVKGDELIRPGLFIEIDNKLQLYGNFQGTCRRGEWDSDLDGMEGRDR